MKQTVQYAALALTVLGLLGGCFASWNNLSQRVAVVEAKLDATNNKLDGLTAMVIEMVKVKSLSRK